MPTYSEVASRRAVEALRSGVPSRDAVKAMGCQQQDALRRFDEQLAALGATQADAERQVQGFIVEGGFGTGKSHLLECFQHVALERGFVCSRVVISKETPLYDPNKVYRAAVESAVAQGVQGQVVQEIAHGLNTKSKAHADLYRWAASPKSGLGAVFPATLLVHERLSGDPELVEEVTGFWAGQKLSIQEIRKGLKLIGASGTFDVKAVPLKLLAPQRFSFVSSLMRAAGFSGWVILFDEVELIGRYSLLQRGRSYAEIARWLGLVESQQTAGLTAVLAITDDFAPAILDDKGDKFTVGPKFREKGGEYEELAPRAERGMQAIERDAVSLVGPDENALASTYRVLRELYAQAYRWQPPEQPVVAFADKAMRIHVRRWINEWDIQRIYSALPDTEVEMMNTDYTEDKELEREREELPGATSHDQ